MATDAELKAGAAVLAASQAKIAELQTRAQRIDAMARNVAALQAGVINGLVPLEALQAELWNLKQELGTLTGVTFVEVGAAAAGALPAIDAIVGEWEPPEAEEG
jgi:conjugal transfer/entry exclusion protein